MNQLVSAVLVDGGFRRTRAGISFHSWKFGAMKPAIEGLSIVCEESVTRWPTRTYNEAKNTKLSINNGMSGKRERINSKTRIVGPW